MALRLLRRYCTPLQSINSKLMTRMLQSCEKKREEKPEERKNPCDTEVTKSLVLGIYNHPTHAKHPGQLTATGQKFNKSVCYKLSELIEISGGAPKLGHAKLFYGLDKEFNIVAVTGLGPPCQGYDVFEQIDEGKEAIRIAAAVGCQALQTHRVDRVFIESFGHAESAAEGAAMGVWVYQENKAISKRIVVPQLELYNDCDFSGWHIGLQKAAAQNLARQLMDTPSNVMTPTSFAQNAVDVLCKSGVNVEIKVRRWAETHQMNAFLASSEGSCEPPIFLELSYYGTSRDERPVVLIGKGVTYNSGGICLKSCEHQKLMRGDMAGAANVVAICRAAAGLQLPLNIRGLIPLCENMPGCAAIRPGDIVKTMNGKTIEIENTDCVGRLILAEALIYAQNFWPRFIVNIGTMTYDVQDGLGAGGTGVFSNSDVLWEYMLAAAMHTGDKVWRLPLWDYYRQLIVGHHNCDLKTIGRGGKKLCGGACKVAAFLNEFVPCGDWIHMDTFGVMYTNGKEFKYLREGMAGRPTRTLVEFMSQLVCHRE